MNFKLKLEWSLVKEIDSDYFLDNKNINHIYENYEFPILAESSSFKDIKSEIKVNIDFYKNKNSINKYKMNIS